MKKHNSLLVFLLMIAVNASAQKKDAVIGSITIAGPDAQKIRTTETISIKWADIIAKYPALKAGDFKIVTADDKEIPFQLESKGTNEIHNLLLQTGVAVGKKATLKIVLGKPKSVISKVYGRYVPERMDDFAWENDKVAFRMYGKALEATKDNAFGIDVWVKRTEQMVIDKWYKSGDYHADHGDGLDYYGVGFTLGAGDIAPYVGGNIVFPKNYRSWKILDNGPIRFSFQLEYDEWDVSGTRVKVLKKYALDAGSQMNRVEAIFTFKNEPDLLPVVVGIVKRKEPGETLLSAKDGVVGYWEPVHGADGITGVGTIMLQDGSKTSDTGVHLLQEVSASNGQPVIYYTGAAWNKAGHIKSAKEWFDYLQRFKSTVITPLKVTLN